MHEIDTSALPPLPARPIDGHKGTFGTVSIIGGCENDQQVMYGAPALAARAALRTGSGLVRIAASRGVLSHAVTLEPSATGVVLPVDTRGLLDGPGAAEVFDRVAAESHCVVIGPGLGRSGTDALSLRSVQQTESPVVVDADALNALAEIPELAGAIQARAVFTPHPGEFRRLAEPLQIVGDPANAEDRPRLAAELAQRLGVIVVLKGRATVVSDGLRAWICDRGHPCLGTAGTGDVLAGTIAGLIAQYGAGLNPYASLPEAVKAKLPPQDDPLRPLSLYDAARLGVFAHAIAGEAWAETHAHAGMLARELADGLPEVLDAMREGGADPDAD